LISNGLAKNKCINFDLFETPKIISSMQTSCVSPSTRPSLALSAHSSKRNEQWQSASSQQLAATAETRHVNASITITESHDDEEQEGKTSIYNYVLFNLSCFDLGSHNMMLFDSLTLDWSLITPPCQFPYHCGAGSGGGRLYLVGGWHRGDYLSSVYKYDFACQRWNTLPTPMPIARNACAVVVRNKSNLSVSAVNGSLSEESMEELIVIGGRGLTESVALDSVQVCDLQTLTWTSLPSLATPRSGCSAAVYFDKTQATELLIVLGGSNCLDEGIRYLDSGEVFSFSTQKWHPFRVPMNLARTCFGMTIDDDILYVVGGWNGDHVEGEQVQSAESIDLSSNSSRWEELPSVPLSTTGVERWYSGTSAASTNGQVFVSFGEQSFVFDAKAKAWTELFSHTAWISKPASFIVTQATALPQALSSFSV
jgi:hypothetical protein